MDIVFVPFQDISAKIKGYWNNQSILEINLFLIVSYVDVFYKLEYDLKAKIDEK